MKAELARAARIQRAGGAHGGRVHGGGRELPVRAQPNGRGCIVPGLRDDASPQQVRCLIQAGCDPMVGVFQTRVQRASALAGPVQTGIAQGGSCLQHRIARDGAAQVAAQQRHSGIARQAFRTMTVVEKATAGPLGIELALRNSATGETSLNHYDAVILATGYERQMHRELLAPLQAYMGDFEVARDYRIVTDERCKAGIYIQGFSQASHGLSDTLLSITSAFSCGIRTITSGRHSRPSASNARPRGLRWPQLQISSAGDPSAAVTWTTQPSQRAARRIDRSCGHAPTTQTGIRGRWTGTGRKVIGPKR